MPSILFPKLLTFTKFKFSIVGITKDRSINRNNQFTKHLEKLQNSCIKPQIIEIYSP